ncbi:MAG: sugar ABC transporter permease [Candidatus Bathyarchaeota archaeon]|nr:MAG: sugar ABC transporter permease [Candidatus Bathyarchaeota archaeon]
MGARKNFPLFFSPALILILFLVVYPIFQTLYLSFVSSSGEFVGLSNYSEILSRKDILNVEGFPKWPPLGALIHIAIWISIHLPLSMFSGLALAIILRDVKGSSIIKSIVFLGMVTPLIVGGIILQYTFTERFGIVTAFFDMLGFEELSRTWTVYPNTALFALIFGSVWLWTGFSMIIYSAGLATIPKEYYEAAKIDGTGPFKTFRRITFPLLRPLNIVVITMTVLYDLKIFDIIFVATFGGPGKASTVLAFEMWLQAFRFSNFNGAAVIATLLTLLTSVVTIPMIRYMVRR